MKIKRLFGILLVMFALAAALTLSASAASTVASGTYGSNLSWTLDSDGLLTISGTGAMYNYSSNTAPWYNYRNQIKSVDIGNDVTSIDKGAFRGCSRLESVTIPDSVTSIGYEAFEDCSSLTSITLPFVGGSATATSKQYLGYLFGAGHYTDNYSYVPSSLKTVILSDKCTSIGSCAFYYCDSLTSVTIGNGVTSIGSHAFAYCWSLESVTIPDSVTSIGFEAFYCCSSLTYNTYDNARYLGNKTNPYVVLIETISDSITSCQISESAKIIYEYAFDGCSSLTSVTVGKGVTSIGYSAFYDCDSLTSVTIPDSVTSIGGSAFYGCSNLGSIEFLGDAPNDVGSNAFPSSDVGKFVIRFHSGTDGWTTPTWNGYPTIWVEEAIEDFSSLGENNRNAQNILFSLNATAKTAAIAANCGYDGSMNGEVTIPDTVWKDDVPYRVIGISENAFKDYLTLCKVTIGNNISSISTSAFLGCSNLSAFQVEEDNTRYSVKDGVLYDKIQSYLYFYPARKNNASFAVPDTVLNIGTNAFCGCTTIKSVTIPDSVTSIGDSAFSGSSLTSVTIGNGVTSIGSCAFKNCSSLESITLPFVGESATSNRYLGYLFGASSFSDNSSCVPSSLKIVILSDKCTSIASHAFYKCSSLTSVTISDSVTSIGDWAFYDCSRLKSVTIGSSVTSIDDNAFADCSSLTSVHIHDLAAWCGISFSGSTSNPLRYAHNLYLNDTLATDITIPNSVSSIGIYAFYDCDGLTSVTIPDSVTSIGSYAFYDCSDLTSVTISDSVTNIGDWAFCGCSSLTGVTIPDSVTGIGVGAFRGCSSLTSIKLSFVGGSATSNQHLGYIFGAREYDDVYVYGYGNERYVPSSLKTVILSDKCTSIGIGAFYSCSSLTDISIPDSVTSIGNWAFRDCDSLTSVTIPDSVTSIGFGTFEYCDSLTSVTIPDSVTSIGSNAFEYCSSLASVTIPDSVTSIGGSAFSSCTGLTNMVIPDSVTSIGYSVFSNCTGLMSVTISNSVTSIGDDAFSGCTGMERFSVSEDNPNYCSDKWGVLYTKDKSTLLYYPSARAWPYYNVADETMTISSYAFGQCPNLVNLYIPKTVTMLKSSCIASNPNLTLCVYQNSPAAAYATSNSLALWYMDNYVMQGIEIYSLPEQTAQPIDAEEFPGLYLVANYGGKDLQLDNYTLSYNKAPGVQKVTVASGAFITSFNVLLYEEGDHVISFGYVNAPSGAVVYAAVYAENGQMLSVEPVTLIDYSAQISVPDKIYQQMDTAKLFILNGSTLVPTGSGKSYQK